MLVKIDNKKTVVNIYGDEFLDGCYYTIIPFSGFTGLRDEYAIMEQNGLGDRHVFVRSGKEIEEMFGHNIEDLLTEK